MSQHVAEVTWSRNGAVFTDNKYSRAHAWRFDGGIEVRASSAPSALRPPLSVEDAVDPEEALVAALSSCHMLWFLAIAAKRGFTVDEYTDKAAGTLARGPDGKTSITEVLLRPSIRVSGGKFPTEAELNEMHHKAHEECYIANSFRGTVRCEPVMLRA